MELSNLSSAFWAAISVALLVASVYIYVALAGQIRTRMPELPTTPVRSFGWPEAMVAIFLSVFFILSIVRSTAHDVRSSPSRDLILGAVFSTGLVFGIAGFLRLRRFDVNALAGFSKMSFARITMTGVFLLLAAYPLVLLAEIVPQQLSRGTLERQEIIEMFTSSDTMNQRALIILMAVSIAPLTEEFLFRFFLYGVAKRYLGRTFGIVANALLFAAVHMHLPSFAPLFVLGVCLTIAYEWSGSILVSMTMHALFNALAFDFPRVP